MVDPTTIRNAPLEPPVEEIRKGPLEPAAVRLATGKYERATTRGQEMLTQESTDGEMLVFKKTQPVLAAQ